MGDFGGQKQVKTRKKHRCETCGRDIPIGKYAIHTTGMFEECWQNWYQCLPCHKNVDIYEYVSGEEFGEWLYGQPEYECPKCKGIDPGTGKLARGKVKWVWSADDMHVVFECNVCSHKWVKHIGFGEEVV